MCASLEGLGTFFDTAGIAWPAATIKGLAAVKRRGAGGVSFNRASMGAFLGCNDCDGLCDARLLIFWSIGEGVG